MDVKSSSRSPSAGRVRPVSAREEKHPAQSGCRSRSTARKNNASASMVNAMAWPTRFGRPRKCAAAVVFELTPSGCDLSTDTRSLPVACSRATPRSGCRTRPDTACLLDLLLARPDNDETPVIAMADGSVLSLDYSWSVADYRLHRSSLKVGFSGSSHSRTRSRSHNAFLDRRFRP